MRAGSIPEFLNYFRLSHQWTQFIESAGTGSVRVRISFSDLAALKLALPPLEEQRRITAILNACDRELDLLRRRLAALKTTEAGADAETADGTDQGKSGEFAEPNMTQAFDIAFIP